MKLREYASTQRTRGRYTVPRSVQQSIPVEEVFADGMWRSGSVYCRMLRLSDINYSILSDETKRRIQALYGAVYAGIPSDCWAKFCIVSQRMDEAAFRRDALYPPAGDGLDDLREELNGRLSAWVRDMGSVTQHKYLILSTNRRSAREARDRLRQVQSTLYTALAALNCTVREVTVNEWLEVLHNFFRIGEEGRFRFDLSECRRLGQDFRDYVCPDTLTARKDHLRIGRRFARCMSVMQYPQRLDDRFIPTLLAQVPHIVLSIDVVPVETEDAFREIEEGRMKTDAERSRFNKAAVDRLDFTSAVPHRTQAHSAVVEQYMTDLLDRDQQMFLTLLTVAFFAEDEEELRTGTEALKAAAVNHNCRFTPLEFQQENAFNTAMPYGLRRIENMRTMTTENVAALVPFNTQEVFEPGGVCYGVNRQSGGLILARRTGLVNGNAMVLATSGGGKSMFVKQEILALYLKHPRARFYIVDPENEYRPLVEALGGVVVDVSVDSETFFNPLDFVPDPDSRVPPHTAKAEFVLSLFEQIMGRDNLQAGDRSLIDRCLRNIYRPLVRSKYTAPCPTLTDLWQELNRQKDELAKEIARDIEIFAAGSLIMFARPTNVDMSSRLICFNIQSLGGQLKPVAMLSMLEYINTCVTTNDRSSPDTAAWVYFDEIYLLLRDELSSHFLYTSWKRFRKYNAYATGITQNIQDCLGNETAYTMLANSEFVCMLRQPDDIGRLAELYGLSEHLRNYLTSARPGQGVLKLGNSMIPFENDCPGSSRIYRLLTTRPGDRRGPSDKEN